MRYHGTVIRPPSEAYSYILQVTYGCSHNDCTFCGTYLDKPFQTREINQVLEDIQMAAQMMPDTRRVFLADGDALALSTRRLIQIIDALKAAFPHLERVGTYANAQNLLNKSDADLEMLVQRGLGIVYLGLESGSDEILSRIHKGATAVEMLAAVKKAKKAGLLVSIIGILGIGGPELSEHHANQTGQVVSQMDPDYFSMLTLMLVPGTKLHEQWRIGEFKLLQPDEILGELSHVIEHANGLTQCTFRTNHASNYLPLKGTLPQDKTRLLQTLDAALARGRDALRPETWRGL
ncbi:MAG: radical SAM protein [Anaerolineales bacterium]|nr:radical SAM protein [Chloroflexota bacterium]MBL6983896.1 radical SAM protein [Anaerolineales bacterium]